DRPQPGRAGDGGPGAAAPEPRVGLPRVLPPDRRLRPGLRRRGRRAGRRSHQERGRRRDRRRRPAAPAGGGRAAAHRRRRRRGRADHVRPGRGARRRRRPVRQGRGPGPADRGDGGAGGQRRLRRREEGTGMSHVETRMTLNGKEVTGHAPADTTLVRWLREQAHAYEVKEGCNEGTCGTCTVLVDGKATTGCTTLAVQVDGARV